MKKMMMMLFTAAVCQTAWATGIDVDDVWARETVTGMSMGGVFMEIENDGSQEDILIGGSSPVSHKIEVHTHVNDNGVMRMREVKGGLVLPKDKKVELKPGGYHIMLMGLRKPLNAGDTFPLTLKFKHAPAKTVTVKVKSNANSSKHSHDHHHDHHHH